MADAGSATSPSFHDHFSGHAGLYRDYRPRYPAALYDAIAERAPAIHAVWDCACGNGQASLGLAEKFDAVYATDASAKQIAEATPHPKVRYSVAPAEASGLPEHSVEAVLVAQAIHWFDFERFYDEVERVVRPGGLFVAVGYENATITPEIDAVVLHLTRDILGPYWPAESRYLHGRYRDLPRRFTDVDMPDLAIEVDWGLEQLVGYVSTWSALQRYRGAEGKDPLSGIEPALAKVWGELNVQKRVTWHMPVVAGRVGSRR